MGIENPFTVLRHRNFAIFWSGNLLSSCGVWIQNLAQGWLILRLSDSPFYLGLAGFVSLFPTLALALLGGTAADRLSRRRILIVTQTALLALSASLGLLTSSQFITPGLIILVVLLSGIALAMNSPAYQAVIPDLVPESALTRAIALNSVQFNLARIFGHSVAGVAVAALGEAGCFYLNALTYLPFLLALGLIRLPTRERLPGRPGFRKQLLEGLQDVAGNRIKLNLILLVGCTSLLGLPYFFLLPVFARDVLGQGAAGLGYLTAAVSVGALGAAFLVPTLTKGFGKRPVVILFSLLFWLALAGFAWSRAYSLSFFLLILLGASLVLVVTTVNNTLQVMTPPHFRGRVMSMNGMALNGLAPLGALAAGTIADATSAPTAVGIMSSFGLVTTAVLVLGLWRAPIDWS